MSEEKKEGWGPALNSPKWHYFRGGRSLCQRYMIFNDSFLEKGNNNSPDNCKQCSKKINKEIENV